MAWAGTSFLETGLLVRGLWQKSASGDLSNHFTMAALS